MLPTRAMEGEMPHAWIAAQPIERRGAWQRGIGDDEMRHLLAIDLRIGVRDHQADVVADGDDLSRAQVLADEAVDVVGHGAFVASGGGQGHGPAIASMTKRALRDGTVTSARSSERSSVAIR